MTKKQDQKPLDVQKMMDKFLVPYLEKNHPNAEIIYMAGSFGRSMKGGAYQPVSSSDIDLLIVYSDLQDGGYDALTQRFIIEDIGLAMGESSKKIMVDCNIHDFKGLKYHADVIKNDWRKPFTFNMLSEAYILRDKKGRGENLQKWAQQFVQNGPELLTQGECKNKVNEIKDCLSAIRAAKTDQEKRLFCLMSYIPFGNFSLSLDRKWCTGTNQLYRYIERMMPEQADNIHQTFVSAVKTGQTDKVERLLSDLILRAGVTKPLPHNLYGIKLYNVSDFVSEDELKKAGQGFIKFGINHFTEALDTSLERGEIAFVATVSILIDFINQAQIALEGQTPKTSVEFVQSLKTVSPELFDALMMAVEDHNFEPLRSFADSLLSPLGGLDYDVLELVMPEDIAMRRGSEKESYVYTQDNDMKQMKKHTPKN